MVSKFLPLFLEAPPDTDDQSEAGGRIVRNLEKIQGRKQQWYLANKWGLKDFERIGISWGWLFWCGCVMSTSAILSSLSRLILDIFIFWQYRINMIQHPRWMVAWFFVQVTCCPPKSCNNRLYHWNCNHATRPTRPRASSSNLQWPGVPSDTPMTDSPKFTRSKWTTMPMRQETRSYGRRQMWLDEWHLLHAIVRITTRSDVVVVVVCCCLLLFVVVCCCLLLFVVVCCCLLLFVVVCCCLLLFVVVCCCLLLFVVVCCCLLLFVVVCCCLLLFVVVCCCLLLFVVVCCCLLLFVVVCCCLLLLLLLLVLLLLVVVVVCCCLLLLLLLFW